MARPPLAPPAPPAPTADAAQPQGTARGDAPRLDPPDSAGPRLGAEWADDELVDDPDSASFDPDLLDGEELVTGAQPETAVAGAQPETAVAGAQPKTAVAGAQPETAVASAQPETAVAGAQPTTAALGLHAVLAAADAEAGARWAERLQGLGFSLTALPDASALEGLQARRDAALVVVHAGRPGSAGSALQTARRLGRQRAGSPAKGSPAEPVVAVVVPVELEGWRAAADLRAGWGVDLAIAERWEDDRLRYHLQVALEARRGEAVPLREPAPLAAAEDLRRQGLAAYKAGNLEQAVACFEAGLARDGCHAALHVSLAVARVKQRRLEDALMAFERALALDPTQATALRSLAVLYEKRGFVHKAVETWERSLHAVDQDPDRREILGRIQKLLAMTSVPA